MVAITILTIAVAGPLYAANRAIVAAEISRDQLTASYLAQEGIEYVRSIRDNKYLEVHTGADASTVAWTNFIFSLGTGINYPAPNLGISTTFTRKIQATAMTDEDEKIVSTVSWSFHGTTYSVIITDHLTPWQ